MNNSPKKTWKRLRLLFLIPVIFLLVTCSQFGRVYETNDVSDYGRITGNFDNEKPKAFIFSFFPEELNSFFSDVTYHYKARKGDTYAYECYLEFVIEDAAAYDSFINEHINTDETNSFRYDTDYMEYIVSDVLDIIWTMPNDDGGYPISYADIGKVLYCDAEQRIIFYALGMWDGGSADTSVLNFFFTRFNIDVIDYQLNAYYSYIDQKNGITYQERYELGMETPYPYPR